MSDPVEIRSLPDAQQERWFSRRAGAQRAARSRLGLVPVPALPDPSRLLCGCPGDPLVGPSVIDGEGGCVACEVQP
jgi:hypothetical protein